jgi:type III secretory pathway component EscS
MGGKKHPLWFVYPRLLVLQVLAATTWIGSFVLFVIADQAFFGMRGWHLLLLVQEPGLYKLAAVAYLFFPLSYLAALRSYRLAAVTAVLGLVGGVVAVLNCVNQPSATSFTYALGPLCWVAAALLVTGLWTAAAVLDRTDKDFHQHATLPGDPQS